MAIELRVDVLACVTNHWMRSDDWFNLFGWWPDGKRPPVVIFSCAGFADIPAEGREADRAIANVIVSLLAGYRGQIDAHEHGSQTCPMAFNGNRKTSILTGRQKFDESCFSKLKKLIPKEAQALKELLALFP